MSIQLLKCHILKSKINEIKITFVLVVKVHFFVCFELIGLLASKKIKVFITKIKVYVI